MLMAFVYLLTDVLHFYHILLTGLYSKNYKVYDSVLTTFFPKHAMFRLTFNRKTSTDVKFSCLS